MSFGVLAEHSLTRLILEGLMSSNQIGCNVENISEIFQCFLYYFLFLVELDKAISYPFHHSPGIEV